MSRTIRYVILMLTDTLFIGLSVLLAYMLRFDLDIPREFMNTLPYSISLFIVFCLFFFHINKLYKRVWEYASVGDLISILRSGLLGAVTVYVIHTFIVHPVLPSVIIPRSIYIIGIMSIFLSVSGSRFMWRLIRDNYAKIQPYHKRALIIGAGKAGIVVVKELKQSKSDMYPVAFIDDNYAKHNMEVMGVPVVGGRQDIPSVVEALKIEHIIIALPSVTRTEVTQIINICKETGCQIKIIPKVNDLINGNISVNMIREVRIEDLLGREPVSVDLNGISGYVQNKVILVSGAGGSIGSELCRQLAPYVPSKIILIGHGENSIYDIELQLRKLYPDLQLEPVIADVQEKQRLDSIFEEYKPQVVFHAAAHKHVPMMEKNPIEAVRNNILGTYNLALCSHENHVERFVMISTDKAVNPTNVMGASKRAAEMVVQSLSTQSSTIYSAVRFGNVLGSRGSVVPLFKRQIEEGGPVTVTDPEMIRYFMTIPEAVQLVIQAGALAEGGEIFILDMGQPVKIADLAKDLIRLSGLEPDKDIKIIYTGIRPGEKLFEELLTSEEGALATKHDRIYVSKPERIPFELIYTHLTRFRKLIDKKGKSDEEIKEMLRNLVPSYKLKEELHQLTTSEEMLQASLQVVASIESNQ